MLYKDVKERQDSFIQRVTETSAVHTGNSRGRFTLTALWDFNLFYLCSEYCDDTELMIDHVGTWICNLTRLDETRVRADMQRCLKGRGKQKRILSLLDRIHQKVTASRLNCDPLLLVFMWQCLVKGPEGSPFCRRERKYLKLLTDCAWV